MTKLFLECTDSLLEPLAKKKLCLASLVGSFPNNNIALKEKNPKFETLDWFTRRSEQVSNKTCELSLFISRQIVLRDLQPVLWPGTWLGEHNMCSSIDPGPLNPHMTAD